LTTFLQGSSIENRNSCSSFGNRRAVWQTRTLNYFCYLHGTQCRGASVCHCDSNSAPVTTTAHLQGLWVQY